MREKKGGRGRRRRGEKEKEKGREGRREGDGGMGRKREWKERWREREKKREGGQKLNYRQRRKRLFTDVNSSQDTNISITCNLPQIHLHNVQISNIPSWYELK